jgi:DNA-directed RNA polymerase subunit RPC12/RpoP
MNARIEKIRQLLTEIEAQAEVGPVGDRGFSALELPVVIQEIVDNLQPLLTPYDAAFYWFLFRHSIANDGSPYIRVSTRFLQRAVVRSSYSQAVENSVSLGKVQETLRALESAGAIRKDGEPNRQGTLYSVLVPDEIEACRKFRAERMAAEPALMFPVSGIREEKAFKTRIRVFERDDYKCRHCQKQLTRFTATLDYVKPIPEGGDDIEENLVTACTECNSGKERLGAWGSKGKAAVRS